ncbi:LuxR C-terminal-related transcriptional regulator [Actinoplanes sp. NPDC023801]|uniref:ATP-binding protein n=1 Tax=Actinoplanes sp. NPDC023801 TaxID=3154595 RepID=UPI0033E1E48E
MITDRIGNLPLDLGPFVGRDDLLGTAAGLIRRTRLLTLTGTGGVGKTRLALRVAAGLDHTCLADLAALHDPGPHHLWAHLALALGIHHHGTAGPDVVLAHLADRPTVLILDACDRLVPQAAAVATRLLRDAPRLRILATSRQRLGVDGEHTLSVPPLTRTDTARLFTALAEAGGVLPAALSNRHAVDRLCRHLDGLPLAVKLAAGRARTMSLPELIDRIGDRFGLLSALERVVDLSYDRCTPDEQALWAATSVFAGAFTMASAAAVAGPGDVAAAIEGLVDKSVLTAATDTHPARFSMLDTLREYGLRRLPDESKARDRHRDHYRDYLDHAAGAWFGPAELQVMNDVRHELPDIVTAVDHSLATGALAEARALCRDLARTRAPYFWGFLDLARTQLMRALPGDGNPGDHAATAAAAGWIAATQGRSGPARELLDPIRDSPLPPVLFATAAGRLLLDADVTAVDQLARLRDRLTGADRHMATMMWAIGAASTGDTTAPALYLAEAETAGAPWAVSWALWTCALAAHRAGDPTRATELISRCLRLQRPMDDQWGQLWSIELSAWILAGTCDGTDERAARRAAWLLGAAHARQQHLGVDLHGMRLLADGHTQARTHLDSLLGAGATADEFTAGRHGHTHALRIALDEPTPRRVSAPGGGLTTREREIAGLVADGLTSPQIATRLRISARTADTHIRNIGGKLGLPNRAAIAAWAIRQR